MYPARYASLCTMLGMPPCVPSWYIPPCTSLGTPSSHTRHRWSTVQSPVTALTRAVAELTVGQEALTVSPPVSLLGIVERGITRRRVLSFLPYNTVGKRHLCAELLPLSHHPFHCWRCFSGCVFLSVLVNNVGIRRVYSRGGDLPSTTRFTVRQ